MSEKKAFLELELKFDRVVFCDLGEVGKWIQKELEFWKWPDSSFSNRRDEAGIIVGQIRAPLQQINAAVDALIKSHEDNVHDRLVANLRDKITAAYTPCTSPHSQQPSRNGLLHSRESRAQYVHDLIETDPAKAAYVAAYFIGYSPINYQLPSVFDGAVTGILFDHGIKGSCKAEKAALEQLRKEWNDECLAAKKINKENEEAAKAWMEKTEADRTEQTEEFGRLIDQSLADLDEYEETIKAKIALQGPVTYWDNKAKEHVKASR